MLLIPVGTKWTIGDRDEKEEKVNTQQDQSLREVGKARETHSIFIYPLHLNAKIFSPHRIKRISDWHGSG